MKLWISFLRSLLFATSFFLSIIIIINGVLYTGLFMYIVYIHLARGMMRMRIYMFIRANMTNDLLSTTKSATRRMLRRKLTVTNVTE